VKEMASAHRLSLFSDAVIAVIITIMVLDPSTHSGRLPRSPHAAAPPPAP